MSVKNLWVESRPMTVTRTWEDGIEEIYVDDKPFVIMVAHRIEMDEHAMALIRYHGYRSVYQDWAWRATRYVRPLPLWAIHKIGHALHDRYWQALGWLHRKGVLRVACDEGVKVRFIDLRPWPLRGRR